MKADLRWLGTGVLVAFCMGLAVGYFRYWFGYFVLGQGVLVGFAIPWMMKIVSPGAMERVRSTALPTFRISLFFFGCFMIAQSVGFGWAQPWFEPLGWLGRVVSGATSEHLFGIALMGGVHNKAFGMGMEGGFWVFLNLFDLVFMEFFLLVGLNTHLEKKKA